MELIEDKHIASSMRTRPPAEPAHVIDRHRLVRWFTENRDAGVTIVRAPAGYGKTTVLRQWFDQAVPRHAMRLWISLLTREESAAKLFSTIFWQTVAICGEGHPVPSEPLPLAEASEIWLRLLAAQRSPTFIFIDGCERADPNAVADLLDLMAPALLSHLHIIVAGRDRVSGPISRLWLDGHVRELPRQALAFNAQESSRLLGSKQRMYDVEALMHATEGWPAAITMLARVDAPERYLATPDAVHDVLRNGMTDYLRNEFLRPLSDGAVASLEALAGFDSFNTDLLTALFPCRRERLMIEELIVSGGFIEEDQRRQGFYRLHRLLRYMLQREGLALTDEGRSRIHHRGARWLADHGAVETSMRHFVKAGRPEVAARLADELGGWWLCVNNGISELRDLVDLPPEIAQSYPRAHLMRIYLLLYDGRYREAEALLKELGEAIFTSDRSADCQTRLQWLIVQAIFDIVRGSPIPPDRDALIEAALRESGSADPRHWGSCQYFSLVSRFRSGRMLEVEALRVSARTQFDRASSPFMEGFLDLYSGMIAVESGDLGRAERIYRALLDRGPLVEDEANFQSETALMLLAEIQYERDEALAAAELLKTTLPLLTMTHGWFDALATGYQVAIPLFARCDGLASATRFVEQMLPIMRDRGLDALCDFVSMALAVEQERRGAPENEPALLESVAGRPDTAQLLRREHLSRMDVIDILARTAIGVRRLDRPDTRPLLLKLLSYADSNRLLRSKCKALLLLAILEHRSGEANAAMDYARAAIMLGEQQGFRGLFVEEADIATNMLKALVKGLPPKVRGYGEGLIAEMESNVPKSTTTPLAQLSPKEVEVLFMLSHGLTSKEIGRELNVAESTIKSHRKKIFTKLGVKSRTDAVKIAQRLRAGL